MQKRAIMQACNRVIVQARYRQLYPFTAPPSILIITCAPELQWQPGGVNVAYGACATPHPPADIYHTTYTAYTTVRGWGQFSR
jgi:hypothetical protein